MTSKKYCDILADNLNVYSNGAKRTDETQTITYLPIEIIQKIGSNLDIYTYFNLKSSCKIFWINMDSNPFLEFEAYKSSCTPKVKNYLNRESRSSDI
jgi:hypothetical protein